MSSGRSQREVRNNARSFICVIPFVLALVLAPSFAFADGNKPDAQQLEAAKELFREGVRLHETGDVERALDFFLRSRALVPSSTNTSNAAICLQRLGRFDEALELYEELVTRFEGELDEDDKKSLGPTLATLRKAVANLDVSANVEGTVVIDGRKRGKLPLTTPIRVLPGKHVLRILKDGYAPFESTFEVRAGGKTEVDARLQALAGAGMLRVEDPALVGGDVFVDDVRVGAVPWEGTLATGRHVVRTENAERGSSPEAIVVIQGQTTLARVASRALGPKLRVQVDPPTALISIDGVWVGVGRWEGRLPIGPHEATAAVTGYMTQSVEVVVPLTASQPLERHFRLAAERLQPTPNPLAGLSFGAFAGYSGAPTLKSDAERAESATFSGLVAGARIGYRTSRNFEPEIAGGYWSLRAGLVRELCSSTSPCTFPSHKGLVEVHELVQDDLWLRGPFASIGGAARAPIGHFEVLGRLSTGILFARSSDPLIGNARTTAGHVALHVSDRNQTIASFPPFVRTDLGVGYNLGSVEFALSLGFAAFLLDGPPLDHPELGVNFPCVPPRGVGCAPNSTAVANERTYGTFFSWVPELSINYTL